MLVTFFRNKAPTPSHHVVCQQTLMSPRRYCRTWPSLGKLHQDLAAGLCVSLGVLGTSGWIPFMLPKIQSPGELTLGSGSERSAQAH